MIKKNAALAIIGLLLVGVLTFLSLSKKVEKADISTEKKVEIQVQKTESKIDNDAVTMRFFGDVMLGRFVRTLMDKGGHDYPFQGKLTEGDQDLTIANLEGPIVTSPSHAQTGTVFAFEPDTAPIIKKNNIDIVSIANNHTLDRGQKGLEETKQFLAAAGVEHFGDPILPSDHDVLVKKIKDQSFAFIGFHDATRRLDEEKAARLVKKFDTQVDHVIVFIHWGEEYRFKNTQRQQDLAHLFIDNGADLIVGHHPHVVENTETYKDIPIYYSLGNFIFDQYWSDKTQHGLALDVIWKPGKGGRLDTVPRTFSLYKSIPQWDKM
jgi:poly-gamma-glutamate synthesis protein (capsule biosynthesis protein)